MLFLIYSVLSGCLATVAYLHLWLFNFNYYIKQYTHLDLNHSLDKIYFRSCSIITNCVVNSIKKLSFIQIYQK